MAQTWHVLSGESLELCRTHQAEAKLEIRKTVESARRFLGRDIGCEHMQFSDGYAVRQGVESWMGQTGYDAT